MIVYNSDKNFGDYIVIGLYDQNFVLVYSLTSIRFPTFYLLYTHLHNYYMQNNKIREINDEEHSKIIQENIIEEYLSFHYIMNCKVSHQVASNNYWINYSKIIKKQNDEEFIKILDACNFYLGKNNKQLTNNSVDDILDKFNKITL